MSRQSAWLGGLVVASMLAGCSVNGSTTASPPIGAVGVTITTAPGETLGFQPAEMTIRAAGPVEIMFRNGSSLDHNLVFTDGLTAATRTIVKPGTTDRLQLAPPSPGAYRFVCTIHEGMAGTLVVEAPG